MSEPGNDQTRTDTLFAGAVPQLYETLMVPLIFEPYAVDLADRLARRAPRARARDRRRNRRRHAPPGGGAAGAARRSSPPT